MKSLAVLFVAFIALVALPLSANAQTPSIDITVTVIGHADSVKGSSSDHFLTFTGPVQIPGVGLAPGSYIFRLVTPAVVQVLNEDRSMVYGMFNVTPVCSSEATGNYGLTLHRMIGGDSPPRIATLFLPDQTGFEFKYPRGEVVEVEQLSMK